MSNVNINIAAEFTGKKAFKQAEVAADKLTNNIKKLAGSLGIAFGAQQIAAYGKRAVKAFADSQLEAVQLTNAVNNLGLAFASRDIDIYIDKVEKATGINRDQLQPAMIKLLQVTGSVTKSQELLSLAMDVSAGTGTDLASTSEKLSQAYVGNFKGLRSLNLGLTQAELASSNFEDVQKRLQVLFAGQATSAADSYVGSLNKLAIASEQASEKIGKSLLDALTAISGGSTVDDTIKKIDTLSSAIAGLIDVTVGLKAGEYLKEFYAIRSGEIANGFGNRSLSVLGQDTQRADLAAREKADREAKKRAAELLAIANRQRLAQAKILKDKRIAAAIDKANVALNKSENVFDIDKIQIAAALTSQAEQLGKATSSAQVMQIANDTARLNVKKSMLALEDAIAAKDEQAIIAATAKLNADLKVLGTLGMQNVKLQDIKSILESLKAKDLINISNLEEALRLLREINLASTGSRSTPSAVLGGGDFVQTPNSISPTTSPRSIAEINQAVADLGLNTQILPNGREFTPDSGVLSGRSPNGREYNYSVSINVNSGIGTDPNAIAEAIDNVLREARDRGTLTIA